MFFFGRLTWMNTGCSGKNAARNLLKARKEANISVVFGLGCSQGEFFHTFMFIPTLSS